MSFYRCINGCSYIDENSCDVCTVCGRTERRLTVRATGFGENVTICVYSRTKRFQMMLKALLYPAFDPKDTVMYIHLMKQQPFKTTDKLESAMKMCETKEKRFHSIHLFSKLMCSDYTTIHPPPTLHFFKRVMILFDEILCRFNANSCTNFFSYPWLIKTLLNLTGETRYNKYIKQIRCVKRNLHYHTVLWELIRKAPKSYRIREWGTNK